nr:catalase-related domain-containing protein [Bacillus taeanensis]
MQGRLFSYTDTQLIRLGGPNFHELPVNRSVCPFHNNQRDGYGRQTINKGQVSYHKNSLANNTPTPAREVEGGYTHYQEKVEGRKIKARSESFNDHFSQATLFWNSMSKPEKEHMIQAFSFELGKVKNKAVQKQVVEMFSNVSLELASSFAKAVGIIPSEKGSSNVTKSSPALSQENTAKKAASRKVGVIISDGFNEKEVMAVFDALKEEGVMVETISNQLGTVKGSDGTELEIDHTFLTGESVLFDALYAVGGNKEDNKFISDASYFINEAFSHFKPIGATHEGIKWIEQNNIENSPGVIKGDSMKSFADNFIKAIAAHRHWDCQVV